MTKKREPQLSHLQLNDTNFAVLVKIASAAYRLLSSPNQSMHIHGHDAHAALTDLEDALEELANAQEKTT